MASPPSGSPPQPQAAAAAPATPGPGADQESPSDAELVQRARTQDAGAFEALVERFQALVSLVAYRQLGRRDHVEDVAQEAFVKAFLHLSELDDPARFKPWLLRITANIALDHLRRRKHEGVSLDDTGAFTAAETAASQNPKGREELKEAGEQAQTGELRDRIVEAIYSLPEEYQAPAAMRYLEEIPYKEISRRMGLREETLRKRIHRANQMLRRKLKNLWPEGLEV
ncbi:MAG: sigma-70 family RNA polymerase sigma factor [Planctomycetota bacterium]|nr:sigma-70 family RNA polymerase sigma factor [Planctomycetota bacterium]